MKTQATSRLKQLASANDLKQMIDAAAAELKSSVKPVRLKYVRGSKAPLGETLSAIFAVGYDFDTAMVAILKSKGYKATRSKDMEVAYGKREIGVREASVEVIYLPRGMMMITAWRAIKDPELSGSK